MIQSENESSGMVSGNKVSVKKTDQRLCSR